MNTREHWEAVYRAKRPHELSWYEAEPKVSAQLIEATGVGRAARVIDVGGGASLLVDCLEAAGFEHVSVMDISAAALEASQARLGQTSHKVEWIEADVLDFKPIHQWEVWHDRAVFHFLTESEDRARYRDSLYRAVRPGGHVIVATFGPDGPERCSGLDTLRCSAGQIARELGDGVTLIESRDEIHTTPHGVSQQFVYARMIRLA